MNEVRVLAHKAAQTDEEHILWTAWYQAKLMQMCTQFTCPACGKLIDTSPDLHHVFFRRKPDCVENYVAWNVRLVHHRCHVPEAPQLNIKCALQIFKEFSPEDILQAAKQLPLKDISLPSWFWEAKEIWDEDHADTAGQV